MGYQQCKFKRYVWELPVRWCHWLSVMSIATLTVTGLFIAFPFSVGLTPSGFAMGWVRFIHFVAGFLFAVSLFSRVAWSFLGNEYSSFKEFFPMFTPRGRRKTWHMLRYYFFMTKEVPEVVGHNPLAASAYTLLFCIYILMIVTGLTLYSMAAPHGILFKLFGWVQAIFTTQGVRLAHHISLYFIFGFVVNHVYSAWLMDIKQHGAEISSMFSGYRFTVHKEED